MRHSRKPISYLKRKITVKSQTLRDCHLTYIRTVSRYSICNIWNKESGRQHGNFRNFLHLTSPIDEFCRIIAFSKQP